MLSLFSTVAATSLIAVANDGGQQALKIVILFLTVIQMLMGLPASS